MSKLRIPVALLIALAVAFYFRSLLFQENLHTVIANEVYRSGQPTPEGLERSIRSIGLRSLINLKGGDPDDADMDATGSVARDAALDIQYVRLSARRWPSPAEVEQLIDSLDRAPRPVLIHCQGGTDRSGLASAVALLLAGYGLDEANQQFAIEYGYPGEVLGSDLPGFLASYRAWLESHNEVHTPRRFRTWVHEDYVAYYYEAELEFVPVSGTLRAGVPFTLQVRVRNRSHQPIPMSCTEGAGVRLSLRLRAIAPEVHKLRERRFCNREEALAPDATTIVETGEYRIASPGSYEFSADLVDENREHFFADMGSSVARQTLIVDSLPDPVP